MSLLPHPRRVLAALLVPLALMLPAPLSVAPRAARAAPAPCAAQTSLQAARLQALLPPPPLLLLLLLAHLLEPPVAMLGPPSSDATARLTTTTATAMTERTERET